MRPRTAKKVAAALTWAVDSDNWGDSIEQTHDAGSPLTEFRWLANKPNLGAFRVRMPERPVLNLALADEYEEGNYYLAVYLTDMANTFVELHRTEETGKGRALSWTYGPRKQDGRNTDRKALFSRLTGGEGLKVALPLRPTAIQIRWFLDDLHYLVEAKIAADELAMGTELDPSEFPEGRVVERLHRARERNSRVVALAKQRRLKIAGVLACDCCGFDFSEVYGGLGAGFIEAHHTLPVSEMGEGHTTRTGDLALVCSNCHRMLHRARPWLGLEQLRDVLAK